jgi:predicted dehydrogenase
LKGTAVALGASYAIGGTKSSGRVIGANDTIRVAVAGLNGRGEAHVGALAGRPGVEIVALVDPDSRTFAKRVAQAEKKGNRTPKTVADVRRVLDDKDVDVLTIAAPNHWHALMTVWGCQAGKDVYVEKPCSHDPHEGRLAVEAARKHQRIVQHGTQGRSEPRWAEVAEIARTGKLGKLLLSRALCYKPRGSIGTQPDGTPPAELDFNLWLGPAADTPFNPNYVHYNWHWFWNFGNGDIGNQGVHQFDIARWMIPGATLPTSVTSLGGRFGYTDQGETPNTQLSVMQFGENHTPLVFEVRGLKTGEYRGEMVGNILHFEAGTVTNHGYFPHDSDAPAPLPQVDAQRGPGGNDHFGNFLAAVRSRKVEDLNAEILEGHYSSALCHLANIAYRVGIPESQFRDNPANRGASVRTLEVLASGNTPMADAVGRMLEHLTRDNGLSQGDLNFRIGPTLTFDPPAERFSGEHAEAANGLLSRAGRGPFVLPERIS